MALKDIRFRLVQPVLATTNNQMLLRRKSQPFSKEGSMAMNIN